MTASEAQAVAVNSKARVRANPILFGVLGAIALLGIVWPFFELRKASLWLDELWTLYFADPSIPLREALFQRIIQDFHPPLYSTLVHFWLSLFSDHDYAARLLSSVLGVGLIAFVLAVGRRFMSAAALAFMAAIIVTGYPFIHFATEARNYMLAFLIGTAQAFCFQVIVSELRARETLTIKPILLLGVLSILNGLTHYYGFLYSGALIGTLLLYAVVTRNPRSIALVIALGVTVFLVNGSYAFWSLKYARFSIQNNWIPGDLPTELRTIRYFMWWAIGGHHGGLLVLISILALIATDLFFGRKSEARRIVGVALPHVLPPILLVIFSLVLSKVWAPSITARNLLLSVPSVWLGMALAMDAALQSKRERTKRLFVLVAIVAPLCGAPLIVTTGGANRHEWRASANFVNSLAACHGRNVPIYGGPRPIEQERFFSHYLDPANHITPVPITSDAANFDPQCPIRLWAVHFVDYPPVHKAIADLGDRARVVEFPNDVAWDCWILTCNLFSRDKEYAALVVLEDPPR